MAQVVKALRDNGALIEKLFGNIEDVVISDSYDTVMDKYLVPWEQEQGNYLKHKQIKEKLSGVNQSLTDEDYYKPEKYIDYDNVKNSGAYKDYEKYFQGFQIPVDPSLKQGGGVTSDKPVMQTFDEFISANPTHKGEIEAGFMKQDLKDEAQFKTDLYKKAGLNDEEVQFYNDYKPPMAEQHNANLVKLFSKYYPKLQGDYVGDKYSKMFANRLDALQMPEEKTEDTKYETEIDEEAGTITYINPKNPNDIVVKNYTDPKRKSSIKGVNYNQVEQDETGKLFFYGDELQPDGTYKQIRLRDLSPQEIKDFETKQDKLNKTGAYSKGTGSKKKGGLGKGKGFNANKLNLDELKAITPDKLAGMDIGELESLKEKKRYLSEETKTELDKMLRRSSSDSEGESDDETTEEGIDNTDGIDYDEESNSYEPDLDEAYDVAESKEDEATLTTQLESRIKDIQAAVNDDDLEQAQELKQEMYDALGTILNDYPEQLMKKLYDYANRYVNSVNL